MAITSIHFKQYDSRWGNKLYGTKKSATYRNAGCGPTSCAIVISSWNKSITPLTVGKWIAKQKNGRTAGGATYYSTGLMAALKHFGGTVKNYNVANDMFKAMYAAKQAGNAMYAILDVTGSKGGVTWTTGGHYIVVSEIKKDGSDWKLYIKDPGLRKNTGWFSYKKHLQGHIKLCCSITNAKLMKSTTSSTTAKTTSETTTAAAETTSVAATTETTVEAAVENTTTVKTAAELAQEVLDGKWGSGETRKQKLTEAGYDYSEVQKIVNELVAQKTTKNDLIVAKAQELAWAKGTSSTTTKNKAKSAYTTALRKAFPKYASYTTNYKTGKTCDMFVAIVMRAAGIATNYPRHRGQSWTEKDSQMLYLTNAVKAGTFKEINKANIMPGDIILYTRDKKGKTGHTCIALADGYVAEASAGDFYPRITKSLATRLSTKDKVTIKVYRAV